MERLAVYGTILSCFPAQRRLGLRCHLRFLGPCLIPGRLADCGRYPGWLPGEGLVRGELYEVLRKSAWKVLDEFEDYVPGRRASEFRRVRVGLTEPAVTAWIYAYNRPAATLRRVPSGDWVEHWRARSRRHASFPRQR